MNEIAINGVSKFEMSSLSDSNKKVTSPFWRIALSKNQDHHPELRVGLVIRNKHTETGLDQHKGESQTK